MKRKLLAVLLSALLLCTMIPLGAINVAAYAWYGNYCYETSGSNATIIYCDPAAGSNVTVPSSINGYTVTSIGYGAFSGYHGLQSITLPNSITTIDERAFSQCTALSTINFSSNITSIGKMAFYKCTALTSLTLPDSVVTIGQMAFHECTALQSIVFGANLRTIEMYAFNMCSSLKSVTLPAGISSIYTCAFANCSSLTDVYYDGTQSQRYNIYIESYNTDLTYATWHYPPTLPPEVFYTISGGEVTIVKCNFALTGVLEIPAKVDGYPVTTIANSAFNSCSSLTEIIFPDTVKTIGNDTFIGCDALVSVHMGNGVTSLGEAAFVYCSALREVDFGDNLVSIGAYAFYGCPGLTEINLPASIKTIGEYAFSGCYNLKTVNYDGSSSDRNKISIGASNGYLTGATWNYAKVDTPTVPDGVYYSISGGKVTITGCNTSLSGAVVIPETILGYPVTTIAQSAFSSCYKITSITLPSTVTTIGKEAFYGCQGLTSMTIPNGVTTIEQKAFRFCDHLQTVSIPASVTSIGTDVFYGCYLLTSITVDSGNAYYSSSNGVLFNKNKTTLVVYPNSKNNSSYTVPDTVTSIGYSAFENNSYLTSITIPVSVTSIGNYGFNGCFRLSSVYYGGSQSNRNQISIGSYNSELTNATWYYTGCDHVYTNACDAYCNDCGEWRNAPHSYTYTCSNYCNLCYAWRSTIHSYDNACDTVCNVCGLWRSTTHVYDNACDTVCNVCGLWRETTHVYDNACDTTCNICGNIREANDHTIIFVGGNDATCTTDGESHWCCTICGFSYVEVIPATGNHVYDNDRDDTCNVCGYVRVGCEDDYHTYVGDWDAVCALCGYVRYLTYTINGDEVTITGYTDDLPAELVIPDTIDGYPVTTIGRAAFSEAFTLTSITLPDSVTVIEEFAFFECWDLSDVSLGSRLTKIGYRAFDTCYTLTSIDLPNSITDICGGAFIGCNALISITIPTGVDEISVSTFSGCSSLISVTIPNSVTAINEEAFANCWSLTEVVIPDSVTYIGERAFGDCYALTEIVIPSSVTTIKSNTFGMCDHLSAIIVDDANPFYSSVDGVLFNKDQTQLLLYPTAKLGSYYVIPDGVTLIGDAAFYSCSHLTSVVIPASVVEIVESGMAISYLSNVYYAGTQAQRENIVINPGNTALHNATWHYNAGVYNELFYAVENEEVTIVGHTDNLPAELVIPDTINGYPVTAIGVEAFSMCAYLTSVTIPDSVTRIGHWAFGACSGLTSITIPNSVITINEGAFTACWNLTTITIPDSVTNIDDNAFSGCTALVDLYLGSGVTNIGLSAFDSCSSQTNVYYNGSATDREGMLIGYGNDALLNATWHYAICNHVYDNDCDTDCNQCGDIREVGDHLYDYYVTVEATCGTEGEMTWICLCCGVSYTETIPATGNHVYDNDRDVDCNVCGAIREVATVMLGDANGDGRINNRDLGLLQQHLNDWDVTVDTDTMDLNNDNRVNNRDLGLLQQYLNDWDVTFG